jgi:hypothetical protein
VVPLRRRGGGQQAAGCGNGGHHRSVTAQPAGQKQRQIICIAHQATSDGGFHRSGVRVPTGGQAGIG